MIVFNLKRCIFFLVTLIMLSATAVAVITYTSATVESSAQVKIVPTDRALLALKPGNDPYGEMVVKEGGVLHFNFPFSENIDEQTYKLYELFRVKNNSANNIEFTVKSEGLEEYISLSPSGTNSYFAESGHNKNSYYELVPGEAKAIEVSFHVPERTQEVENSSLVVKAKAIN